jgi:hypothetical protein
LFKVRAADTPAKLFGALAVDSLLHPQVRLCANNNSVFHGSVSHGRIGEPESEMRMSMQAITMAGDVLREWTPGQTQKG